MKNRNLLYLLFIFFGGLFLGIRDNINQVPLNILNFILLIIALILLVIGIVKIEENN